MVTILWMNIVTTALNMATVISRFTLPPHTPPILRYTPIPKPMTTLAYTRVTAHTCRYIHMCVPAFYGQLVYNLPCPIN